MKQFFLKALLLVPIPIMILWFNLSIDPVHLADSGQYEYGIAQLILDGKSVTNITTPDEAALITFYVAGLDARKDVLVFGFSRSELIHAGSFPGMSFHNSSVSGGGIVDDLAIYNMYMKKNLLPSVVVLEMSPWLLYPDHASVWKTFNAQREELEARLLGSVSDSSDVPTISADVSENYSELFSIGYFQTSLFTWLRRVFVPDESNENYTIFRSSDTPMGLTLLDDGGWLFPETVLNHQDIERIAAAAIAYGENPIGIPERLYPEQMGRLEAFVKLLRNNGARVIFYLPPYHPKTYDLLINSPRFKIIIELQKYFESLALRNGITVVGSYNPADIPLDATAFFDASHTVESAIRQIFDGHMPGIPPEGTVAAAGPQLQIIGIKNPNGLEMVNNKPFFWIGQGDTCLNINSTITGSASLTFQAFAGPSLPGMQQRHLLLTNSGGYRKVITISEYPSVTLTFSTQQGLNVLCLTPLDKPTVLEQPNGDRRPLLIGVSDTELQSLPSNTILEQPEACVITFLGGWYDVELNGKGWWRWTAGQGQMQIFVDKDSVGTLSGEVNSVLQPNTVDILVNGNKATNQNISQEGFMPFESIQVRLTSGKNVVEFASHNPAITIPTDSRPLAIAIKNLQILIDNSQPCKIQP